MTKNLKYVNGKPRTSATDNKKAEYGAYQRRFWNEQERYLICFLDNIKISSIQYNGFYATGTAPVSKHDIIENVQLKRWYYKIFTFM